MKLGDDCMKIHADLTCMEPFAYGFRDSELEKSALKMVTVRVIQFRSGVSKPCFLCRKLLNKTHIYLFVKDVTFQLAQLKELWVMILSWKKKIMARWVPHLLKDQQKKQRVECLKDLLKMFEQDGPNCLGGIITGDETWLYFYGILNKQSNQM